MHYQTINKSIDIHHSISCIISLYSLFCEECIDKLVESKGAVFSCPKCRKKCSQHQVKRVKFIDRQIKNLLIKCPNHEITAMKAVYIEKLEKKRNRNNPQRPKHKRARSRSRSPSPDRARSRSRSRSRDRDKGNNKDDKQENKEEDEKAKNQNASNKENEAQNLNLSNSNNSGQENQENDREKIGLCEWTGKLEKLSIHIRECPFEIIRCRDCDECIERGKKSEHAKECHMYPIQCELCGLEIPRSFMQSHVKDECMNGMIECNYCKNEIKRKEQKLHFGKCPEAIVTCDYYRFGCDLIRCKRKDVKQHMDNAQSKHLELVTLSHKQLEDKFERYKEKMDRKMDTFEMSHDLIERRMNQLESTMHAGLPVYNEQPWF